jgi:hypothetical protein
VTSVSLLLLLVCESLVLLGDTDPEADRVAGRDARSVGCLRDLEARAAGEGRYASGTPGLSGRRRARRKGERGQREEW